MVGIQKLRVHSVLKWISFLCSEKSLMSSKYNVYVNGSHPISQCFMFCTALTAADSRNGSSLFELAKKSRVVRKEAQAVLLDYLHSTRSLRFIDAENMSRNSPEFFDRLSKRVDVDLCDVGRSLARFLRYHPINEFEPFFESIGLKPSEYASFLPRDLMFLSDDELLLENYYVLCNFGFARNKIGRIYKEAMEVFQYDYGVLQSKLQSFQNLGLGHSLVVKIITSSPYLLKGTVNTEFLEVLERFKKAGFSYDLLEEHIDEGDYYNWKSLLRIMCLLSDDLGFSEEQLVEVITHHPRLLLEGSGQFSFSLLGFLSKFGFTRSDVQILFLQFPQITVAKFTRNLFHCYRFLVEIKMPYEDVSSIVCSYPLLLGSCELKKISSLAGILNCGLGTLRQMVTDDPNVLKKWILGTKVNKLPQPKRSPNVRMIKTKFLLDLGFIEKSKEMEKALKVFRGKGLELQERFDCLVNAGLSRDEVIAMVKVSPQILNQSKEVIETKIDFFVNELGYLVSDLVTHPATVSYTIERVKLRLLTYKWLKNEGVVHPKLALSTLMSCSEEVFIMSYVDSHPRGREYWTKMKKKIYG